MESWRKVWREGVAPLLSDAALAGLASDLRADSPLLIQGATTEPPPLMCVQDWPCVKGCLLGRCGMHDGRETVGDVEEFFAQLCFAIDERLGEPAACRWLLNWFDEAPREEMRAALLPEVERAIAERRAG